MPTIDAENTEVFAKWRSKSRTLWYLGDPKLLEMPLAAIVGSREVTDNGIRQTQMLARLLVQQGWCVVSGLAKGIDRVAHETALDCGGATIAVLGTSIEECYPSEHKVLKQRIEESGLVLSQFAPGERVHRANFPRRNELMAAMCVVSFVVEASLTSGTRHQVKASIQTGHKVGFLPAVIEAAHPWVLEAYQTGHAFGVRGTRDALELLLLARPSDAFEAPDAAEESEHAPAELPPALDSRFVGPDEEQTGPEQSHVILPLSLPLTLNEDGRLPMSTEGASESNEVSNADDRNGTDDRQMIFPFN
jgi:DNA processing protein